MLLGLDTKTSWARLKFWQLEIFPERMIEFTQRHPNFDRTCAIWPKRPAGGYGQTWKDERQRCDKFAVPDYAYHNFLP